MRTNKLNLLITGCVKNAEKTLKLDFERLKDISKNFNSTKYLFIESDSSDKTISLLANFKSSNINFNFISLGTLKNKYQFRSEIIAKCRNEYVHQINKNEEYKNVDLVLIVDLDNINFLLKAESVLSCFEKNDWDAVFANQEFAYYDIYALRHKDWSPNDYRNQLNFYDKYRKNRFLNYWFSGYSRMIHIPKNSDWIPVISAFGGAAIYKKECFLENTYVGSFEGKEQCEHVSFNKNLKKKNKKLFICPNFINSGFNEHHKRLSLIYKLKFIFIFFVNLFKKN